MALLLCLADLLLPVVLTCLELAEPTRHLNQIPSAVLHCPIAIVLWSLLFISLVDQCRDCRVQRYLGAVVSCGEHMVDMATIFGTYTSHRVRTTGGKTGQ